MVTSAHVSRLHRSGSVTPTVRLAAARAGVFSVTSTVLAVVGHHVVFDVSPSWAARGVLAGLFFALVLPGAGGPGRVTRQLVLTVWAQGLGVGWFTASTGAARTSGCLPLGRCVPE
ncbi:hypothetical protein ACFZDJ_52290 [Streptomyces sp. NPDC007896]|uniref:hypothetical protein n=1 Tax=unclassified Streptomyces TaxID=2593676 RepID=UPI0036E206AD